MAPPKASRLFQVVVAAGVSLVACGNEQGGAADASANALDGAGPKDATTVADGGPGDAGAVDASSDAIDEMPLIR